MHLRSILLLLWIVSIQSAVGVKPLRPPNGGGHLGRRPVLLLNDTPTKDWLIDRTQSSFPILARSETPVVSALTWAMVAKGLFDLWHKYFGRARAVRKQGLSMWDYVKLVVLYAISHTDLIHLLVNLFLTHCYGTRIEKEHGSGWTLALVGSVVLGGGLINLAGWNRFDHHQGRGSSGISLALLSAYAFGDILKQNRAPARFGWGWGFRTPKRKESLKDSIGSFVYTCWSILDLQLLMLDKHLSVHLHAYGLIVGTLFALWMHEDDATK